MKTAMPRAAWERRVREVTRALQSLTGGTQRQVVLSALEHRLAVLTGPASADERVQQAVMRLRQSSGSSRKSRPMPSLAERDHALGDGKEGV